MSAETKRWEGVIVALLVLAAVAFAVAIVSLYLDGRDATTCAQAASLADEAVVQLMTDVINGSGMVTVYDESVTLAASYLSGEERKACSWIHE